MTTALIGHNSVIAELSEKILEIRDRMKVAQKTGSARARWEILCSDMDPTDKFIALVMSCFADDGEEIQPTVATLEILTGYKKRVIMRGIQAAKKADVIEQKAQAYRGAPAVYAFKVPDKTLRELAQKMQIDPPARPEECIAMHERVRNDAPIAAERVHEGAERVHHNGKGCMEVHERVHEGAPLEAPYIESKNNKMKKEDAPETNADMVHVNGIGILGPGFSLDYKSIDNIAALCGMSSDTGKLVAELAARRWAAANFVPDSAVAVLRRVMAKEKIHAVVDKAVLEKELAKLKAEQATPQFASRAQNRARNDPNDISAIKREVQQKYKLGPFKDA